ncbi:MAG: SGNH/GDSL hydrolase family protein [Chitinophagaceae bacterium]|nr:SGNH/GDSL hydrolase family protein [Oligoflexus sp.]
MNRLLKSLPLLTLLASCGSMNQQNSQVHSEPPIHLGPEYLALGDSISFGYNPLISYNAQTIADGRFRAFPEVIADALVLQLTNPSCVGESTSSFIDKTIPDNGCRSGNAPAHANLKINYDVAQLDFAVDFLKKHPGTKLITMTLTGNDVLMAEDACNLQSNPTLCKASKMLGVTSTIAKNLNHIVDTLRATGFDGQIVYTSNYARNYKDPIQFLVLKSIQAEVRTIARLKHFKVASGFDAFNKVARDFNGDSCKAGLLILLADGTCNEHPSVKGHELLAQTIIDVLKD